MRYFSLFILVFFVTISTGRSQKNNSKLTVQGVRVTIKKNDSLYVKGNVHVKENNQNNDNIHNEGNLIITDTLFSDVDSLFFSSSNKILSDDSSEREAYGVVTFKEEGPKYISGNSIYFASINVENSTLTLDTNIYVFGSINLNHENQSNIYLNGNDIQLYNLDSGINIRKGTIDSSKKSARAETSKSRIYDDSTGMIKAYKHNKNMPANLGFFVDNTNYGYIFVHRFHKPETNVTNSSMAEGYIIKQSGIDKLSTNLGGSIYSIKIHYLDTNLTSECLQILQNSVYFKIHFQMNYPITKILEGIMIRVII